MTPQQIHQVRHSFALLAPKADAAAALFYTRLFQLDPELRQLFRGSLHEQGAKLMQMIAAAVKLLDRPDALQPVLCQLGARHQGYGVEPAHYVSVGNALLDTLAVGLGDDFDASTRAAWVAMYALVSRTMLEAAAQTQAA